MTSTVNECKDDVLCCKIYLKCKQGTVLMNFSSYSVYTTLGALPDDTTLQLPGIPSVVGRKIGKLELSHVYPPVKNEIVAHAHDFCCFFLVVVFCSYVSTWAASAEMRSMYTHMAW